MGHNKLRTFEEIKNAINKKHPVGLLLMKNLFDWHWIMVVGYREYKSGQEYLRIVDGWNNTYNRFYKINNGSYCIRKTEYFVEK